MTNDQKLREIIALLTFIQRHIENSVKQSFTDLSFSVESIVMDFLNVFEIPSSKYTNLNGVKSNFPAIDLYNKSRSIAIQVTTNADAPKVKKTIKIYGGLGLNYKELKVLGFVKHSKMKIAGAEILGIDYLINLAKHGTNNQLDQIYEILHRQVPLNILNPSDDKMCFAIVFDVINRSAVRDSSRSEGSYEDMVNGLKEIKEIITTGQIRGKQIRAKTLVEYGPPFHDQLSEIEFDVSKIIQICNTSRNTSGSHLIILDYKDRTTIDDLKDSIVTKTNLLAKKSNLGKEIKR